MKLSGLVVAALSGALVGCGVVSRLSIGGVQDGPVASGPTSTRTYDVSPFSRIQAGSIFDIEYVVGPKTEVEIEAQQTAFDHIEVISEEGELHLRLRDNLRVEDPIKVRLTSPSLDGIQLSGASQGSFQGISSPNFDVALSGAASASISGIASVIRVQISGSSDLETTTRGQFSLTGTVSGAGSLKAGGEVNRLDIQASGSSHVDLDRLAARQAVVELSAASTINSKGSVDTLSVSASGASEADFKGLRVGLANVTANGGSHVSVGDTKTLTANASGGSTVNYKGTPSVTQSVSGGASVGPG